MTMKLADAQELEEYIQDHVSRLNRAIDQAERNGLTVALHTHRDTDESTGKTRDSLSVRVSCHDLSMLES